MTNVAVDIERMGSIAYKSARRKVGWEQVLRRFACDCADRVLYLWQERNSTDVHVQNCIETARKFANGDASDEELQSARDAAGKGGIWEVTAGHTAWATARDAGYATTEPLPWDAAEIARGYSVSAAARHAHGDVAWDAIAAMVVGERPVGNEAMQAAWDAELSWQGERMVHYLSGNS